MKRGAFQCSRSLLVLSLLFFADGEAVCYLKLEAMMAYRMSTSDIGASFCVRFPSRCSHTSPCPHHATRRQTSAVGACSNSCVIPLGHRGFAILPAVPTTRMPQVHCVVLQYLLSVAYRVQISAWYTTSARLHGATPAFFVKPLYQAVEPRDHRLRQPILGFCPIVVRV